MEITKTCKHCNETYAIRDTFTLQLLLTYCTVACAVAHGMSDQEANKQFEQTVWLCSGCKGFFPHEDLIHRKGDYGYTPLCLQCADDPKYYCFFPYDDRLAAGLVSTKEQDEHNRNWNAFHDM